MKPTPARKAAINSRPLTVLSDTLLVLYLLLGPGLWLVMAVGIATARVRMGKLQNRRRPGAIDPSTAPSVAIVVPARNEAAGIARCLRSILAMHYPTASEGRFRVVAVDDRSTDGTADVMDQLARQDGRLTVLRLTDKPDDWLGKCHAIAQGVGRLSVEPGSKTAEAGPPDPRGPDWLLFIDSDVTVRPDALLDVLSMAIERQADAVSILTRQRCETLLEKMLTPLGCGAILAMYVASWTNEDRRRRSAFANGQFFLVRRALYERVGGHASVRQEAVEDVMLMRRLKAHGGKCRLYSGDHLAETRMYDSLPRMFKGWARIYASASHRRPWRILLGMLVVGSGMAAFAAVAWSVLSSAGTAWTAAASVHLLTVLGVVASVYRWSGNSPWLALLFPLAATFQQAFYLYALWWCLTNRMEWRGTVCSAAPTT